MTFCLSFLLLSASAQLTYETLYVDYDSAFQFKNLKIVPIRRKGGGDGCGDLGEEGLHKIRHDQAHKKTAARDETARHPIDAACLARCRTWA